MACGFRGVRRFRDRDMWIELGSETQYKDEARRIRSWDRDIQNDVLAGISYRPQGVTPGARSLHLECGFPTMKDEDVSGHQPFTLFDFYTYLLESVGTKTSRGF